MNPTSAMPAGQDHCSKELPPTSDNVCRVPKEFLDNSGNNNSTIPAAPAEENASNIVGNAEEGSNRPGAASSNTAPENRQSHELGGIDWLELSILGEVAEDKLRELERCKSAAQQGNAERAIVGTFLGHPIGVAESTARSGGMSYPYRVTWQGVQILIRRSRAGDEHPACRVVMPGTYLTMMGHQAGYEAATAVVRFLGVTIAGEVVSRVDLCADLLCSVRRAAQHFDFNNLRASRVVTRSRSIEMRSKDWEPATIYVRSQDLVCRMYDKLAEVQSDEIKLEMMIARRWGGELPSEAMRVEFELHRDCLREKFRITTYAELSRALPMIWHWCTNEWLRLVEQTPDRDNRHQDRSTPSEFWREVIATGEGWIGEGGSLPPVKAKPQVTRRALQKMFPGVATSLAAWSEEKFNNIEELTAFFMEQLSSFGGVLLKTVNDKRRAIRLVLPAALVPSTG